MGIARSSASLVPGHIYSDVRGVRVQKRRRNGEKKYTLGTPTHTDACAYDANNVTSQLSPLARESALVAFRECHSPPPSPRGVFVLTCAFLLCARCLSAARAFAACCRPPQIHSRTFERSSVKKIRSTTRKLRRSAPFFHVVVCNRMGGLKGFVFSLAICFA